MTEEIKWYDAKNYDRNKEALRICENCGHISEMHEWSDWTGESCVGKDCLCTEFKCKMKDGLIVYDGDESR